ncbi:MAG: ABC transporter permease [Phycisphaerales bacterium]
MRRRRGSPAEGSAGITWGLSVPLLALFVLPVAALISRVPIAQAGEILAEEPFRQAVRLSLISTAASVALSILLGAPLAAALAGSRRRGGRPSRLLVIIEAVVDLPTVLPPAVAGLALLLAFGRAGPIGGVLAAAGLDISFSLFAVVIAQTFVGAPLFVRAFRAGLEGVDADLLDAASMDGASRWVRLARVSLPLAGPGFGAGCALCAARALGEFGATIVFAGSLPGVTQTLPLSVYVALHEDLDRALLMGVLLLGLAVALLGGARLAAGLGKGD